MAGEINAETTENLLQARRLFEDIYMISAKQKSLLEAENEELWPLETILELLDERQKIINLIEKLDYLPTPSSDQSLSPNQATGQAMNNQIMDEIQALIKNIQTNDAICQDKMQKAMPVIMNKLNKTRENKKAQLAYDQGEVLNSAWFIDQKS
ncbi:Flagellar protein FliT [Syntrophomonas zehnderi OL-4]|uniref:Flagellar protein FliT n=1 Tax=Syntrophomonas zehnderi OL-4 TaxID=690567 RepID=A0A0E4GTX8_9FIRM|nr:flagellar protein FliT [Syntrophomonas zehnderi]CQB52004.1 Flagellar protein FliT [Syntrophomonas zehnderi OL-4]